MILFSKYGQVNSLIRYKDSDEAYVQFEYVQDAYIAKDALHGYKI